MIYQPKSGRHVGRHSRELARRYWILSFAFAAAFVQAEDVCHLSPQSMGIQS
jgi:hypothetical protein